MQDGLVILMSSSSQSTSIFGGSFAQPRSQDEIEDEEIREESIDASDLENSDASDVSDDSEGRENVKSEGLNDDIDILSVPSVSEPGYEESDFGDIAHIRKADRTAASKWKHYTKKDRDFARGFFASRQKDLTRHLLSAHGLSAADVQSIDGLDFRYSRRENWSNKSRKEKQVISQWTQWPNEPETVPRQRELVWKDSLRKKEKWFPSRDLEEDLFGFMLKKARNQWAEDVLNDGDNDAETKQAEKRVRKTTPATSSDHSMMDLDESSTSDGSQSDVQEVNMDKPVFPIDDDHNRRILQPIIRSTISQFDKFLISLDNSSKTLNRTDVHDAEVPPDSTKTRDQIMNSQPTQFKTTGQVDWSQVLGIAAISSISPEVIARATSRCAAMFNEEMGMQTFNDDGFKRRKAKTHRFTTEDYRLGDLVNVLDVKDGRWSQRDLEFGCPISTCPYPRPSKGKYWPVGEAIKHMTEVHGWKNGTDPPSISKEELSTSGGLKTDGFLLPIDNAVTYVPGPEALRKIKNRTSGRRKRQTESALDDLDVGAALDIGPRNQDVLGDLRFLQPTVFDGRPGRQYQPANRAIPSADMLPIEALLQERTVLFGKQLRRILPRMRPREIPSHPSKKSNYLAKYLVNTIKNKRHETVAAGPIFGQEMNPYVVNPRLFQAARKDPTAVEIFNEEREERLQRQKERMDYEGRFARGEVSPDRIIRKNVKRNEPGIRGPTREEGTTRGRSNETEDDGGEMNELHNASSPNADDASSIGYSSVEDEAASSISEAS